jgi:hypothetical protein
LLHLAFTLNFATNFVGSLDIRAYREVFPIEVNSPEIANVGANGKGVVRKHKVIFTPGVVEGLLKKNEHRTSNVQHRMLNGKR